ncbi:Hsp70 family protein [Photobacterium sp. 1_MG-2023]|uniref:Hsp70 family protein n=1 Tax=Photobacterium sp. 1_MG-2023 TaxID=3062646 RepID=UPI0026E3882F|nr:Hsp70 family protein [Photobacterium sp. 1_MG-2023]MDO6708399.1 Hsp70 family protein [Photobacterium sp. 1_MG-2023]
MSSPRYLVGIDLGTTHTVVAYCPITPTLQQETVKIFDIDQLIGPGEVSRKPLLPSFRYHPTPGEIAPEQCVLPWAPAPVEGDFPEALIGEYARELGSKVEGRQVTSAKSWLSHTGVDRNQPILPWAAAQGVKKVSPVIASASYLNHVRQSWDYHHPDAKLAGQDVVLTIPASFDESARALTVEAAKLAGLNNIVLLEEPQAACYDWYTRHQEQAATQLKDIPLLMVCDVGGGTTDLSLIRVSHAHDRLKLDRVGVGDHLMLGGDNLDLTLAHIAESQLNQGGQRLNAATLSKLIQQTRRAKEQLLAEHAPESVNITLLGSGSKLIGSSRSTALSQQQTRAVTLDGFFPLSDIAAHPEKRQSAVVEFGLPYAADPAISKHLAQFISEHQTVCRDAMSAHSSLADESHTIIPPAVLLNGGVFNSPLLSNRLLDIFSAWKGDRVTQLDNPHPDLAVAFGAVAYGKARHGAQLKIGGGSARSFFLALDQHTPASGVCLLPRGTEESIELQLPDRKFALTLGEPVRFNLVASTDDTSVQAGDLTPLDHDHLVALPPFIVTLDSETDRATLAANQKERVDVTLACQLTEVGTLQLECVSTENAAQRWQVEFSIRKNTSAKATQATKESPESAKLDQAETLIKKAYGGSKMHADDKPAKSLRTDLEALLGKREQWDMSTLRPLADTLLDSKKRRRRSAVHERNWLKLAGFTLRPGFGDPIDDWRINQIWPLYQQSLQFHQSTQSWNDWWIFWRRIAGGLNQTQQELIYKEIAKYINPSAARHPKLSKEMQEKGYEQMVRLLASLERLSFEKKLQLIEWLFARLQKPQYAQAHWWAIGRIACRHPLYGSRHNLLTAQHIAYCLPELMDYDWRKEPEIALAAVMMCRKTGDRTLDIDDPLRQEVIEKLEQSKVPESWVVMVSDVKVLTEEENLRVYGDSIPSGLMLIE